MIFAFREKRTSQRTSHKKCENWMEKVFQVTNDVLHYFMHESLGANNT